MSGGLFLTDEMWVQGLNWCKDEPKKVGLPSLARKILCEGHNSKLSEVDDAAIDAFNVFRECTRLSAVREQMKERLWNVVDMEIDGVGLERWFLKTLINVAEGGNQLIGPDSLAIGQPSHDLIEVAFGLRKFGPRVGLYSSGQVGEKIDSEDRVTTIPFSDEDNKSILGANFFFRGFHFILYLGKQGLANTVNFKRREGDGNNQYTNPVWHLDRLNFIVGPSQKRISHVVRFKW